MFSELISTMNRRGGFAPQNRFRIEFSPPGSNLSGQNLADINLLCQSTPLPGRQYTTIDAPLLGFRQSVKYPNGYMNEDITVIFLMTNDFYIKRIFDRWGSLIVDPDRYLIGYDDDYKVPINLYQLDQNDKEVYGVQLLRAFPTTFQAIEMNNGSNADPQRFSVSFTYEDYIIIK